MAIAKNPNRPINTTTEKRAEDFITKAGTDTGVNGNRKQTAIRVPPDLLPRIDRAAKRLGISRSAFLVISAVEKMERMES
jgi:hypothetical protein